jgi:hypothetical protein
VVVEVVEHGPTVAPDKWGHIQLVILADQAVAEQTQATELILAHVVMVEWELLDKDFQQDQV